MIDNFINAIKKGKINNEFIINVPFLKTQITKIEYLDTFQQMAFGTKRGEFMTFDIVKREAYMHLSFEGELIT